MRRYTEEEIKVIKSWREKGLSTREISIETEIPHSSIRYLIRKFIPELNTKEIKGKIHARLNKIPDHNGKYKLSVEKVKETWDGKMNLNEFSDKLGIHPNTLSLFLKKFFPEIHSKILSGLYKYGEDNRMFKGAYPTTNGYMRIATKNGRKLEHRVIVEKYIRRELIPGEIIHHIDGNKTNNNPNNLVLCKRDSIHRELHHIIEETLTELFPEIVRDIVEEASKNVDGLTLLSEFNVSQAET
jgi:hypothetical protein